MTSKAAGWYPDQTGTVRYWDGTAWANAPQVSATPGAPVGAGSTGQSAQFQAGAPGVSTVSPALGDGAAPAQNGYAAPAQNGYAAPAQNGYAAPAQNGYAAPAQNGYAAPTQSTAGAQGAYASPNGSYTAPTGYSAPGAYANQAAAYASQAGAYAVQPGMVAPAYLVPPAPQSNWMGVTGFALSLSLLLFFWVPVMNLALLVAGLVFSIMGMRREPKGLAIAGVVISSLFLAVLVLGFLAFGAFMAIISGAGV
ncbi:DUF2510 domain-containing protein [Buchananella felis]|uniref:DUF2510 domain-containing protein n=1 Tax=Buchananella felis TaxID=3231492 RepID=UPI0035272C64